MATDEELARQVLVGLFRDAAKIGVKAALSGIESVLSDAQSFFKEGERRIEHTRRKVRARVQEVSPGSRGEDDDHD